MARKVLVGVALAALSLFVTKAANATNYTLYLHGMSLFAGCGSTPGGWCYWSAAKQPGVNAVPVNFDGTAHISAAAPTVKAYLDSYCTGSNACYVAVHSEGAAVIGYLEAVYPAAWNIYWVVAGGSAAGGSELANAASWAFGSSTVSAVCAACSDLQTGTVRGLYNHDALGQGIHGYVYNDLGGDWATWDTCFFPGGGWACLNGVGSGGGNDRVIAYHSSGHYRAIGNYGSASANGGTGGSYWDYTITNYVDDESTGSYSHTSGLGGTPIMNITASVMGTYAK
jgi:hypothetical protein